MAEKFAAFIPNVGYGRGRKIALNLMEMVIKINKDD